MTDELVELEMAHLALDKQLRDGDKEEYKDPTFEEYDRETEEEDNLLSFEYDMPEKKDAEYFPSSEDEINSEDEEWEDV